MSDNKLLKLSFEFAVAVVNLADSIRNWFKRTDIPAHRIGKLWKFK